MLPIFYTSADQGAPILNNAAGSLISVLDACLVTGFNSVGIFSITITDNVATVVTSSGHGLKLDTRATVTGVSISAALGDHKVSSVINPTTFTFVCVSANATEIPVSATVKRTPLGFAKIFSSTNVGMYKSLNVLAYGQSLRVDDTNATGQGARVFGVENPSSITAWTDNFPTEAQMAGGLYWPKSPNNTTPNPWCIIGDDRFFYLLVAPNYYTTGYYPTSSGGYSFGAVGYFGDLDSNKPGEAFGAIIGGSQVPGTQNSSFGGLMRDYPLGASISTDRWAFIARQYSGVAKSVRIAFNHPGGRVPGDVSHPRYPSPIDSGLNIAEPSLVCESLPYANNPVRGVLPGFATFLCNHSDLPQAPFPQKLVTTDGSNREYLFAPYFGNEYAYDATSCFAVKMSEAWR